MPLPTKSRSKRTVGRSTLTFEEVSETNAKRCARWHPGFPDDETWGIGDWSNAMCGEVGELAEETLELLAFVTKAAGAVANDVKKLRRIEGGHRPNPLKPEQDLEWLQEHVADEAADVFLYLDLLCTKLGLNLPGAIVRKFNEVSVRQGFAERL